MLDYNSMKLTIGVGISFYQDRRSLMRCIESVLGDVDYIICVDGKYLYNDEDAPPLSTDGSREYVLDKARNFDGQGLFLIDAPNLTEAKKRQVYVDLTKDYGIDVLLILDSDEYVYCCNWLAFRTECYRKMIVQEKMRWNIWNVAFKEPMDRPRLWFKAWEIMYNVTHYDFCRKDDPTCREINLGGDMIHLIGNMVISHRHNLRDGQHQLARERWEKKQQSIEDAHRLELREQFIASRQSEAARQP